MVMEFLLCEEPLLLSLSVVLRCSAPTCGDVLQLESGSVVLQLCGESRGLLIEEEDSLDSFDRGVELRGCSHCIVEELDILDDQSVDETHGGEYPGGSKRLSLEDGHEEERKEEQNVRIAEEAVAHSREGEESEVASVLVLPGLTNCGDEGLPQA